MVRDDEDDFTVDFQRGLEKHVQGVIDDTLGGVFDGNHTLGALFPLHGVKDLADALLGYVARRGSEGPPAGLVSEGGLGTEVGDRGRFLEVAGGGENFTENGSQGVIREGPPVLLLQACENPFLPGWIVDVEPFGLLDLTDLLSEPGPPVEEIHQLLVDAVDFFSLFRKWHALSLRKCEYN